MREEIYEQGFVIKTDKDTAEIALTNKEACESCDSLFCSTSSDGENILVADNEIQAKVGDYVKVMVAGSAIFKATFLLYVLPLFIMIASLMLFFNYFHYSEIVSFLSSLVVTGAYYSVLFMVGNPKKEKKPMPKIISIKEFHQPVNI